MTLEQMLASYRSQLAEAESRRDKARAEIKAIGDAAAREGRSALTAEEDARVTELFAERDEADKQIAALREKVTVVEREIAAEAEIEARSAETQPHAPRPKGGVRVTAEPEVYRKGGPYSYFRDLYRATQSGNREAIDRLARNDRMVFEARALSTTDGAGGEFVPPLWMVDEFVRLARAGRVVADQVAQQTLPPGTDSISLPRLATGTAVAEQTSQNTAVQETDATTNSVTAAVATIAGVQTVSQQLLDQSPINMDEVLLADLAADYAVKLDLFVINNNAANKRGLLNVTGKNTVTYTSATPTPAELYPKVADAIQQIHTGRYMPADKIFMHPRRWAWLLGAVDGQNRPLVAPDSTNSVAQATGVVAEGRVGTLQGLPVFVDPNIPTNLGTGTNEDAIIVARSADVILFEGSPRAEVFRETAAKNLSVVLRFYNYAALHSERYPKAISVITGTGLVTPTF